MKLMEWLRVERPVTATPGVSGHGQPRDQGPLYVTLLQAKSRVGQRDISVARRVAGARKALHVANLFEENPEPLSVEAIWKRKSR